MANFLKSVVRSLGEKKCLLQITPGPLKTVRCDKPLNNLQLGPCCRYQVTVHLPEGGEITKILSSHDFYANETLLNLIRNVKEDQTTPSGYVTISEIMNEYKWYQPHKIKDTPVQLFYEMIDMGKSKRQLQTQMRKITDYSINDLIAFTIQYFIMRNKPDLFKKFVRQILENNLLSATMTVSDIIDSTHTDQETKQEFKHYINQQMHGARPRQRRRRSTDATPGEGSFQGGGSSPSRRGSFQGLTPLTQQELATKRVWDTITHGAPMDRKSWKKLYRTLALKYHPDRTSSLSGQQKVQGQRVMKILNEIDGMINSDDMSDVWKRMVIGIHVGPS